MPPNKFIYIVLNRTCHNGGSCVEGSGDVTTSLYPNSRCYCIPPYGGDDCSTSKHTFGLEITLQHDLILLLLKHLKSDLIFIINQTEYF